MADIPIRDGLSGWGIGELMRTLIILQLMLNGAFKGRQCNFQQINPLFLKLKFVRNHVTRAVQLAKEMMKSYKAPCNIIQFHYKWISDAAIWKCEAIIFMFKCITTIYAIYYEIYNSWSCIWKKSYIWFELLGPKRCVNALVSLELYISAL